MNRRQKIIVSITGIFLVLLILVGLTYAYFLTRINGNDNEKSISVTTANLELTYGDGTNKVLTTTDPIIPSNDPIGTKDFTVTNNGNATVNNYAVYLEDIENKLTRTSDLVYTLTCTSSVQNKTCNGKSETVYPNKNGILVTNNIDKDEVQTYVLTLTYKEMNEDQSTDMNKTINGKIQIYNLKDIVDIEGTVTNALTTDYVQINSVEKKSQIINGEYKLPAVEPGTHTIRVFDKDGTEKSSRQITIKKGKTASVSGNTITITDDSQTVTMNLDRTITSSDNISNTVNDYMPFEKGTLAYNILTNAKNKTNGTMFTANLSSTNMVDNVTTVNDKILSTAIDDYGTTYYSRGNPTDNYVNYAGMCWRIVRIEGDGSTKLILASEKTCSITNLTNNSGYATDGAAGVQGTILSENYGYKMINGYYKNDYINNASSTNARTKLNAWLERKITSESDKLLLKNETWCIGDQTNAYKEGKIIGTVNDLISSRTDFYYTAGNKYGVTKTPSYKCETTGVDGEKDVNKVGMLTFDEVVYAGGGNNSNSNYYLNNNAASNMWWLLSLYSSYGSGGNEMAFLVKTDGGLNYFYIDYTDFVDGTSFGLRPVVTLKSGITIASGNGTISNPYVIK